jgi:trk system potassium uptake protein TrkA
LIETPAAFETVNFSKEELMINGYKITENLDIAGFQLKDLTKFQEFERVLFLAIIRELDMLIPTGNDYLLPNDKVYVIGKGQDFEAVDPYFSESEDTFTYVFVIGVTRISRYLCSRLQGMGIRVKVIEPDRKECLAFAEEYHNIEVVNCNPTNLEALQDEGISNVDVFIALSNDEEENILSCMIAKKQKVKKTIAKIQKKEYLDFVMVMGIDAVINPKISTVGEILRYVRGGNILSVDTLGEKDAEAIEYLVTKENKLIKTPIKDLELPDGCLIAAIISGDDVIIPRGDDFFDVDDKVIVFTAPNLTTNIGDLFI